MFITVPRGVTVHIQDIILHHLDPDRHDAEIEIMDAFVGQNLTTKGDIQQQLLAEGTKTVKFKVRPNGLTTTVCGQTGRPLHQAHNISDTAVALLLSGWIITAVITHIMYRYIQKLQTKLDSAPHVSNNDYNHASSHSQSFRRTDENVLTVF